MFQLLSLETVAQSLGVSPHSVRKFVREGRLSPTRVCRRLLFDPQDVEEFVRKAQGNSQSDSNAGGKNRNLETVR